MPSPVRAAAMLGAAMWLVACADEPIRITTNTCGDFGPGLADWVQSMDTDGDGVINSDEFDAGFEDAENEVDGKLTNEEFRESLCSRAPYAGG
jgi:hypothetical protein